jgi:hypothetical protein
MNVELPGFPPTGGTEFDQTQRRFGEDWVDADAVGFG